MLLQIWRHDEMGHSTNFSLIYYFYNLPKNLLVRSAASSSRAQPALNPKKFADPWSKHWEHEVKILPSLATLQSSSNSLTFPRLLQVQVGLPDIPYFKGAHVFEPQLPPPGTKLPRRWNLPYFNYRTCQSPVVGSLNRHTVTHFMGRALSP